ncbi:MAG: D-alanyl-D-alanine carboxypeptidase family protein [Candidatus Daviesbacteria bacterium]|nr:D-alanyl-D-alanine carboxypeptidase family protein [Candidatus Daviesbacteria bacterium]
MIKKVFIGLLLLGVILLVGVFLLTYPPRNFILKTPEVLGSRVASNEWQPKDILGSQQAPKITAHAAYFVDIDSGEVLYKKNEKIRAPVASLVKVMTAIVTLENRDWADKVEVSSFAASQEPDHMILQQGEVLTVEELLYGVFLISGNDAAEALAESITGDRIDFIKFMNTKASLLGMRDTLFINPSGLQEDTQTQYSTAYDVALMSRFAIKQFPKLLDISSTPYKYIEETETHQDYTLYSGINLLTTYPGVVGFKTGYTPEAGMTLITVAKRDGRIVLGVLLNSESRRDEARELLDYSFKKLGID